MEKSIIRVHSSYVSLLFKSITNTPVASDYGKELLVLPCIMQCFDTSIAVDGIMQNVHTPALRVHRAFMHRAFNTTKNDELRA